MLGPSPPAFFVLSRERRVAGGAECLLSLFRFHVPSRSFMFRRIWNPPRLNIRIYNPLTSSAFVFRALSRLPADKRGMSFFSD